MHTHKPFEETLHKRKSPNPEEDDSCDESSIDHHNTDDDILKDTEDEEESMPSRDETSESDSEAFDESEDA